MIGWTPTLARAFCGSPPASACPKHALISLSPQPGEGGFSYDPVLFVFFLQEENSRHREDT